MGIWNSADVFVRLNEQFGLTDMILPFLLVFTLVFAVLEKAQLFGKEKKNINMMLSLIIALLFVIPHVTQQYPPDADPVLIVNNAVPSVSVVIVAIVMMLIIIGVFGVNINIANNPLGGFVTLAALAVVFFIFAMSAGWFNGPLPSWLAWLGDSDNQALIIVLVVFIVIIGYVTGDNQQGNTGKGFLDLLNAIGKGVKGAP